MIESNQLSSLVKANDQEQFTFENSFASHTEEKGKKKKHQESMLSIIKARPWPFLVMLYITRPVASSPFMRPHRGRRGICRPRTVAASAMSTTERKSLAPISECEGMVELRRGPWTLEEDTLLIHYIACHGEGRWNLLAKSSGLKRTGKSCRLRWLNYLKPDIKRGNLSPEEQLLILDLHSKWGNRWSRIAQHLPGRTDNEIKNYWRTRVQKQARQLKVDANSALFRDAVRSYWMPRLLLENSSTDQYQVPSSENLISGGVPLPAHNMFDEMTPRSSDELDGAISLTDPIMISSGGGYCSMNNAYEVDPWNLAPMSASPPTCSVSQHTTCSKNDVSDHGLWSMDELYDMLKSYMSGAESKFPFGDDNSS